MDIKIKQIEAYDVIFSEKFLTVKKLKEITQTIKQQFGDIPVCFFFDSEDDTHNYQSEKYFNGVFNTDSRLDCINLCPALNSSESLIYLHDLEDMVNRIPIGSTLTQSNASPLYVEEDTIVHIGARTINDKSGKVAEIFIVNDECFILTSTYGINWESQSGFESFCNRTFAWFYKEYCEGLDYNEIYRIIF